MIVQPHFLDHWKTNALGAAIGRLEAITALLSLWAHCQNQRCWQFPKNELMLAGICRFSGNPRVLVDTLLQLNLLEMVDENTVEVHEWAETNGALVHNWNAGKKGGRPRKQPKAKPKENPRVNPLQTQGKPKGEPIRYDKIRENPPNPPEGGTSPAESDLIPSLPEVDAGETSEKSEKEKGVAPLEDMPAALVALEPLLVAMGRHPQQRLSYQEEQEVIRLLGDPGFTAAAIASVAALVAQRQSTHFNDLERESPLRSVRMRLDTILADWPNHCVLADKVFGEKKKAARPSEADSYPWQAVCWHLYGEEPVPWHTQTFRDRRRYKQLWGSWSAEERQTAVTRYEQRSTEPNPTQTEELNA